MKVVMLCFVLAAFGMPVAVAKSSGSTNSPVEKVVQLIEELKANLEHDEKVEQQIHDKYSCWCEITAGNKAANIVMGHRDMSKITTTILQLKSEVATLASEVADLSTKVAENEEAQKAATAVRTKENTDYSGEKADLEQAISALERAIRVLGGAGTASPTGLLQDSESLSTSAKLQAANLISFAIGALPARGVNHALTPQKLSVVEQFTHVLREPTAADGATSSASATVQGILKDMYDSFTSDLESQTTTEASSNRDFEDLIAVKVEEANNMHATIKRKEEEKATAEVKLAENMQLLDDTTKEFKADVAFFDQMKADCYAKHEEFTVRSEARKEEIAGISKALEILTSDDARALFSKSIKPGMETMFLQVNAKNDENSPVAKAYQSLKKQAKATHSIRLASLAAMVRTTGVGHFDEVIKKIDEMIQILKDEEKEDIKQRDHCTDEYHANSEEKSTHQWDIKNNEAKIVKIDDTIATLIENIEDTQKEITSTKKQLEDMKAERTAEHESFEQAKKDDEGAAALLGEAIEALSGFYAKEGIDVGFIQGSAKAPEFAISKDQAPDATYSDKGARKNQSKGIISILTMLKEDLEAEVKNGIKDEVKSQEEYESARDAAEALQTSLEEKEINLKDAKAKTIEKKTLEETDLKSNEEDLGTNEEYKTEIKPDCDWMLSSFQERVEKRKAEIAGLTTAKEFLAGGTPSMLETSKSFDDSSLSEIGFRGMSFLQRD